METTPKRRGLLPAFILLLFILGDPLFAHARFSLGSETPPRNNATGLKEAPCGGVAASADRQIFEEGSTVAIEWEETVDQPGKFLISFSAENDTGFDEYLLYEVEDQQNDGQVPHKYSAEILMPSIQCDNCTLQLTQVVTDSSGIPMSYYSCSDISLVASGQLPDSGGEGNTGDVDTISDGKKDSGQEGINENSLPRPPSKFKVQVLVRGAK
tara:strand:+ start:234 stop:869 length:636 start_codon:yes stop_codon:yes gene_type:complete